MLNLFFFFFLEPKHLGIMDSFQYWRWFGLFNCNIRCIIAVEESKEYFIKNLNFTHLPLTLMSVESVSGTDQHNHHWVSQRERKKMKRTAKENPNLSPYCCFGVIQVSGQTLQFQDKLDRFDFWTRGWQNTSSMVTWYVFVYYFCFVLH